MKINREQIARRLLMLVAFSALASLLLIAVFIFKEGLPFFFKVGLRHFLLTSVWDPATNQFGIEVSERVPIVIPATPYSEAYLAAKREKLGHLL